MGKHTISLFKAFVFAGFSLMMWLTACHSPAGSHQQCSNHLPDTKFTDTVFHFSASEEMKNNYSGMALIPAGEFKMGAVAGDSFAREEESPKHLVNVDSFWMDSTEVTNREFQQFVNATHYKTTAERMSDKGSLVFRPSVYNLKKDLSWWSFVAGADWRHPYGPNSNIDTMGNYPVVHVSWYDAMAYASWAAKRLPTEAEWEYAARGGLTDAVFPWGNENPEAVRHANVFEGEFPNLNTATDGFAEWAPVASYSANAYGLYDMSGNVWEWCADKYHSAYYSYCADNDIENPIGPEKSYDPERKFEEQRVIRGGSFMCNKSYCAGYRVSARNKTTPTTSLMNVGFRCCRDGAKKERIP